MTSLGFMNRGVTLLSNEPARAGIDLIFIYIVIRTVFIKSSRKTVFDLLLFMYLAIFIQSFMAISLYLAYIILIY